MSYDAWQKKGNNKKRHKSTEKEWLNGEREGEERVEEQER